MATFRLLLRICVAVVAARCAASDPSPVDQNGVVWVYRGSNATLPCHPPHPSRLSELTSPAIEVRATPRKEPPPSLETTYYDEDPAGEGVETELYTGITGDEEDDFDAGLVPPKQTKFNNQPKRSGSLDLAPNSSSLSYSWRRDGAPLKVGARRQVTTSGALQITGTRRSDEGDYQCAVTGVAGTVLSTNVKVRIAGMHKEFATQPSPVTAEVGESFILRCKIQSQPPANISWEKSSSTLHLTKRHYILGKGYLLITNATAEDAGAYRCVATNNYTNRIKQSQPATVTITPATIGPKPIEFVDQNPADLSTHSANITFSTPSDIEDTIHILTAYLNDDVVLSCAVKGRPIPKVVWSFRSLDETLVTSEFSSMEVLRLKAVQERDAGVYTCSVEGGTEELQRTYSLHIIAPAHLILSPVSALKPSAGTVRFNCSAGPSGVVWYKDGVPLTITGRLKIKSLEQRPPELIVSNTVSSDAGVYQCFSVGAAGSPASGWGVLRLRAGGCAAAAAAAPRVLHCAPLSPDSLAVTWQRIDGSEVVAYTVHYTPTDGGDEHTEPQVGTKVVLKNVEPFASYHIYVKTYCKFGASDQSKQIICQGQGVPFTLSSLGNGSVIASWKDASRTYPRVRQWQLQWKIKDQPQAQNITLDYGNTSYIIPGLAKKGMDKLEVRVLATSSLSWVEGADLTHVAWLSPSDAMSTHFTDLVTDESERVVGVRTSASSGDISATHQSHPTATPTSLIAMATSPTAINVTWQCDAAEDSTDSYFFYVCYARAQGGNGNTLRNSPKHREKCVESYTSWLEVAGLEADTSYAFKVQAVVQNRMKGGPFSATVTARTNKEDNSIISDIHWSTSDGHMVNVSWSPLVGQNETGTVYRVFYGQNVTAPINYWKCINVTNGTHVTVSDLSDEGTTYISVRVGDTRQGAIVGVPPLAQRPRLTHTHTPPARSDTDTVSDPSAIMGAIIGVVVSIVCAALCGIGVAWQKRRAARQQLPETRIRKSDLEGRDEADTWDSDIEKSSVGYVNGAGRDAGEPLLNGHVHITDNPRFIKGNLGNGRSKVNRRIPSSYDGTLDVSRYDDANNTTLETILEADISNDLLTNNSQTGSKSTDSNMNSELAIADMSDTSGDAKLNFADTNMNLNIVLSVDVSDRDNLTSKSADKRLLQKERDNMGLVLVKRNNESNLDVETYENDDVALPTLEPNG